jgi:hypothetical protein
VLLQQQAHSRAGHTVCQLGRGRVRGINICKCQASTQQVLRARDAPQ